MALKALGYDDVMIITHSTGGVVALEYITSRLFDHDQGRYIRRQTPDEQLEGLPDVFGSVMWMSPLNGLEWYVSFAALFTMEDQQSLPDLAQDSEYLNGLKRGDWPNMGNGARA